MYIWAKQPACAQICNGKGKYQFCVKIGERKRLVIRRVPHDDHYENRCKRSGDRRSG
jgi:hypothetical protein